MLASAHVGPAYGCKIHVRQVPSFADEKDLRQTLSDAFGEVVDSWLAREKHSARHRGFGNVTFAAPGAAERALNAGKVKLHGAMVHIQRAGGGAPHAPPAVEGEPPAQRRRLDAADGEPSADGAARHAPPPHAADADPGAAARRAALAKLSVDELAALLQHDAPTIQTRSE